MHMTFHTEAALLHLLAVWLHNKQTVTFEQLIGFAKVYQHLARMIQNKLPPTLTICYFKFGKQMWSLQMLQH